MSLLLADPLDETFFGKVPLLMFHVSRVRVTSVSDSEDEEKLLVESDSEDEEKLLVESDSEDEEKLLVESDSEDEVERLVAMHSQ